MKTSAMQNRTPGTDSETYSDTLAEATKGDGYTYCFVQKNSETFPGHRSQLSNVLGKNSLTQPGKKMWELVTDENLTHFIEDEENVLVRRLDADTEEVTRRDATPRGQGAYGRPIDPSAVQAGTQHDFRANKGTPLSLAALETQIPTQAQRAEAAEALATN